jgi:cytochrome P460
MNTGFLSSSRIRIATLAAAGAGALALAAAALGQQAQELSLSIAKVSQGGKLQKPADLDSWVFLGTSLGMGYNPGSFNAEHPGQFQVVLMEPNAYRHFVKNGSYAPGSMFLLSFYNTDQHKRSINQNGFTQADLTNYEIHLIDPSRGKDGRTFFVFGANDIEGAPLPAGNNCVSCHTSHGAFEGTFAQFYPTLRPLIPREALERAAQDHDIR